MTGKNARVRIVARPQGRGVLDEALEVEAASAQPDGRFVLSGFTPGRHLVQAARDGIWLSAALELMPEEGKALPFIALDIPEPGGPMALEVVDPDGRPIAAVSVAPARPDGPLKLLWAAKYRTDSTGVVPLWGLEAGRHSVLIGDPGTAYEIEVPAAGASRPKATRVIHKQTDPAPR